jgi:DNA gyrase/topoisomerase IV subunit A
MIMRIADLVRDKKLEGIRGLRDESTKDIRVVVELKQARTRKKFLTISTSTRRLRTPSTSIWWCLLTACRKRSRSRGSSKSLLNTAKSGAPPHRV